eukprot:TRINITY_DN9468_c0_g1_i1.p1 TRINITY_DN9468_c0_g1~~TRINITY_DN9468_c0_g1_i1.p1  ORF type:complete len:363 (-),score=116.56 TRINITY_DN9468_c0_g1_i1:204-1166(-)
MGHAGSRHKRSKSNTTVTDAGQLLSEELVAKVSTEEIESLEELFHSLSIKKDKDESISFDAFQEFVTNLKSAAKLPAKKLFEAIDIDKSGTISKKEFLAAMFIFGHGTLEEKLKFVFHMYDPENKGLDKTQVRKIARACSKSAGLTIQFTVPEGNSTNISSLGQDIDVAVDEIFKKFEELDHHHKTITFEKFYELAKDHKGVQSFLASLQESLPMPAGTPSPQASPTAERRSLKGSRSGIKMERQTGESVVSSKNINLLSPLSIDDEDDDDDSQKNSGKKSPSVSPSMGRRSLTATNGSSEMRAKTPPRMVSTSTKISRG